MHRIAGGAVSGVGVLIMLVACHSARLEQALTAMPTDAMEKLDSHVRAAIDSGHSAQVILLGRRQLLSPGSIDRFRGEHADADRLDLRRVVVGQLKAIASHDQREILGALHIANAERTLWIANAVLVTLTPDQIRRAAALTQVAFIYPAADTVLSQHSGAGMAMIPPPARRTPFNPAGKRISWNVRRLGAPRVWNELHDVGEGVVIASLDFGANYLHHDLRANIWSNPREVAGNGRDDDGNGYIDDLYGYDFSQMTPDVRNTSLPRQHGTMTSGILVGDGTDGIITGVAPRSRLMILRGVSTIQAALAYQYAIDNGADVLSMSFSLPDMGDLRGFWRIMSDHAVAAGLVLVGGAGNFRKTAPLPTQVQTPKDIPVVIAVGGVDTLLQVAPYSSGGPVEWAQVALFHDYPLPAGLIKPDVMAFSGPGYPVLGPTDSGYVDPNLEIQGNSFSGPQAAGVAALILSAAPRLPAWRVKEILEATAQHIGPAGKNNDMGMGLIDAYAAVRMAQATRH